MATDQVLQSILPDEMHGVAFFSGYRGLGKSFLASQADLPQNILFLDYESKGEGIDAQLNFGQYHALTQKAEGDPQKLYNATMAVVNGIPENQFTVAIFDNVSPFELAMNAEAARNAEKYSVMYGLNLKNIKANRFGGTKAIVNFMISDVCATLHRKGVKLIIATSHIKARWGSAGPIPNKFNMKGADRWQDLSILTLVLIPGVNPPVPSALVQKEQLGSIELATNLTPEQIAAMKRGDEGHKISRRLPPKLPDCTFQAIRKYLHKPANFNKLTKNERPTVDESDPFSERISAEQLGMMKTALDIQDRAERDEEASMLAVEAMERDNKVQTLANQIKEILGKGYHAPFPPAPLIVTELKKISNVIATVPEVAQAMIKMEGKS